MWIIIKDHPKEFSFQEGKKYQVFGPGFSFVFDDNCESVWLYDLTYEKVEGE